MPIFHLAVGAFIASYLQNNKFRKDTDKIVNTLIGQGLRFINKGGAKDVQPTDPTDE